jgi:exosortase/archaeosortase family protein
MEKNVKKFVLKGAILIGILLAVTFIFRFPIDYFRLNLLRMTDATRIFSKSDGMKIFALAGLFFTLYYQKRIAGIAHEKTKIISSASKILTGFFLVAAYYGMRCISNIYEIMGGFAFWLIYLASIILLLSAFFFFMIGVFSQSYILRFYKALKKELWITGILCIIAYNLLMLFQNQWGIFSYSITLLLARMFSPIFPTTYDLSGPTPLLRVNDFSVSIGAPCSGIESMFLFAAFAVGIFALDSERLKKAPYLIISIIGLIGIYFVNVLRLFLLILTGIYISPTFAVGMFHTNVGWLLFVIYFLCYYLVIRKFIYIKSNP